MPRPNAVVSTVVGFQPSLERPAPELLKAADGLTVELADGQSVRLDPDDEKSPGRAQILDGLRQQGLPVYLEIDAETSAISTLLIPYVTRVTHVTSRGKDGLEVELEHSHARHRVRREDPDFHELEGLLREAWGSDAVFVLTEDDAHEIIDVRPYRPGPEGPVTLPPFPRPEPRPLPLWPRIWRWCWWPWRWWCWFRCRSAATLQQIFDDMSATSCNPLTVPPPCIPFLYPDDGCWGRAHEMCRLMIARGLNPRKVWIQGGLTAATKNNPSCAVHWGWHVAPTLCQRTWWPFCSREMVIDPSLFTTPVSKATWKSVQGDPNATLTDSDASIFYLWGSVTDPSYTQTNQVLATYRMQLQNRSLNQGPPPYANCP